MTEQNKADQPVINFAPITAVLGKIFTLPKLSPAGKKITFIVAVVGVGLFTVNNVLLVKKLGNQLEALTETALVWDVFTIDGSLSALPAADEPFVETPAADKPSITPAVETESVAELITLQKPTAGDVTLGCTTILKSTYNGMVVTDKTVTAFAIECRK